MTHNNYSLINFFQQLQFHLNKVLNFFNFLDTFLIFKSFLDCKFDEDVLTTVDGKSKDVDLNHQVLISKEEPEVILI